MVSSIGGSNTDYIQQLLAQMMNNMSLTKTDSAPETSKSEISPAKAVENTGKPDFMKMLGENFDKADTDQNGQLSKAEISAYKMPPPSAMGMPPGLTIENLFSANDTDGTAGLSKDELSSIDTSGNAKEANFVNKMTQNFDKLDTNQDGQLSADEVKAAKPHHAHHATAEANQDPSATATADSSSSSDATPDFGETLNKLSDFLFKKLTSAYQDNEASINSGIKAGIESGFKSALSVAV